MSTSAIVGIVFVTIIVLVVLYEAFMAFFSGPPQTPSEDLPRGRKELEIKGLTVEKLASTEDVSRPENITSPFEQQPESPAPLEETRK